MSGTDRCPPRLPGLEWCGRPRQRRRSSGLAKEQRRSPHPQLQPRRVFRNIEREAIDHVLKPLEAARDIVVGQVSDDLFQESIDLGRHSPTPIFMRTLYEHMFVVSRTFELGL